MHTRRALLTGASAAAAMAVAGALTPAEGSRLPGVAERAVLPAWDRLSEDLKGFITSIKDREAIIYGEYEDLPPLRHITISSDAYSKATEALINDLIRQLEA